MELQGGNYAAATSLLQTALQKNAGSAEANANMAIIALQQGKAEAAETLLGKATEAANYNEVLGNINIAKGNYAAAAQQLAGVKSNSAALAQILAKNYEAANQTLAAIANPDATTSYLKAIVAARTNQQAAALAALKDATAKDASLKARAATDLEFAGYFNNSTFKSLVK